MKRPGRNQKPAPGLSRRIHYEDEYRLPWLAALLECHAIADTGVAIAVRDVEKKEKKVLACDACRYQPDILFYPHEVPGLRWYVLEKLEPSLREVVRH